jgi:hypothetical protein
MTQNHDSGSSRESGQILAVFALALVTIVAMAGLVLDGGFSFVQRRDEQNAADGAALAAAYAYGFTQDVDAARTAARTIAAANGYVHGSDSTVVDMTSANTGAGREFVVTISKPHRNYFAGIVGMPTWEVSATATTKSGWPNAAYGAMPIIFNQMAFDQHGAGPSSETTYPQAGVTGPNPAPQDGDTFNWTMYCDSCNADTSTVTSLIDGGGLATVVTLDDKLDPLNSGVHNPLYDSLAAEIGNEFPVPIVDSDGNMVGWAMFHLTDAVGGSTKSISGYFVSPVDASNLVIDDTRSAGANFGDYTVYFTN